MYHGLDIFKDPLFWLVLLVGIFAHRNDRSSYGAGLSNVNRRHPWRG